ncbi:MAG: hypothetical protein V1808_01080 [Candidatus Daviesbacteria bacterium]
MNNLEGQLPNQTLPPNIELKPSFNKKNILVFILGLIFIVTAAFAIKYFQGNSRTQTLKAMLTPTLAPLKYGIEGKAAEATSASQAATLGKIKINLDAKQKIAFSKVHPDQDLSKLTQLSGKVTDIDNNLQSIKVTTDNSNGWIKIASSWSGNTLNKDPLTEKYFQKEVLNIPKGDWTKMVSLLKSSTKVLLLCTDSTCKQSIGGHIYLN